MIRALLLAAVFVPAASAAERPPLTPQRDVDVTYATTPPRDGTSAPTQRMRWSVATGRLRVDPPTAGLYMIVDYRAKRMSVVKPGDRAVLDVFTGGPGLPGAQGGDFQRRGAAQVAGLACTEWQTTDAGGSDTLLCLTADGVMLRASQAGRILVEATGVSYGPQDPAAFVPPEGYRHVAGGTP